LACRFAGLAQACSLLSQTGRQEHNILPLITWQLADALRSALLKQ
jgi:hypothetical protein